MSYYDTSYPPSLWTPPPPIQPTGATPGAPGSFPPAGCVIPANLTGLQTLGALGQTTAGTAGQYVVLGNTTNANWSGTAWAAGIHAADEPSADETEFKAIPVDSLPEDIEPESP